MKTKKIIPASQAHSINRFTNTKLRILNCNANIYFNRTYLEENLKPKYANININFNFMHVKLA
jgi:hypothetical protein